MGTKQLVKNEHKNEEKNKMAARSDIENREKFSLGGKSVSCN
jgi:hypothetical protein